MRYQIRLVHDVHFKNKIRLFPSEFCSIFLFFKRAIRFSERFSWFLTTVLMEKMFLTADMNLAFITFKAASDLLTSMLVGQAPKTWEESLFVDI